MISPNLWPQPLRLRSLAPRPASGPLWPSQTSLSDRIMQRSPFFCLLGLALGTPLLLAQPAADTNKLPELRFPLRSEPKNLHPLRVVDEAGEAVRFLTSGTLVRLNRVTQKLEPNLAESWNIGSGGKSIRFTLRNGLRFSDGTPFTPQDIEFTINTLFDPKHPSPIADGFRVSNGKVETKLLGGREVEILFPAPVASLDRLFDTVAILSANSPQGERASLGPYYLAERKAGSHIYLARNPYFWKRNNRRESLPRASGIRLEIVSSREMEVIRFRAGELHALQALDGETFERLGKENPASVRDSGPGLESELLWFNLNPNAPIERHKKSWFQNANFRRAISSAIRREDMVRLVFRGHASVPASPAGKTNRQFHADGLRPLKYDIAKAKELLKAGGFTYNGRQLVDKQGNPVVFSLITNGTNKARTRIASLVEQDLSEIGIKLNLVILDFASLVERISRTFNYESCLLSLSNMDLDPNTQMNFWLSSGSNHAWYPEQKSPSLPWEAEIDRLMKAQAIEPDPGKRQRLFAQAQKIVWEEVPMIYLVTPNALSAISPRLQNTNLSALKPRIWWNVEQLSLSAGGNAAGSKEVAAR